MSEVLRFEQEKWVADFLVSEANLYRSREVITIPQGPDPLLVGSLVTLAGAVATAGNADAILMYPVDPRSGPVRVTAVVRDAEVNDAYLVYGTLDQAAVNERLATHNIIVRPGVMAQSIITPATAENLDSQATGPTPAAENLDPQTTGPGSTAGPGRPHSPSSPQQPRPTPPAGERR